MENTNTEIEKNPFWLEPETFYAVKAVVSQYKRLKSKAETPPVFNDYDNIRSPGNISNPGAGRPSTISKPTELLVEKHMAQLEEIRRAQRLVGAVDNGIVDASRYASTKIRRDIRSGLRQMLIEQRSGRYIESDCMPKTLNRYKKIAIFFIAYHLGYITDEEVVERNLPPKILDDIPLDRDPYPWEIREGSAMAKTLQFREQFNAERTAKREKAIQRNRERRLKVPADTATEKLLVNDTIKQTIINNNSR